MFEASASEVGPEHTGRVTVPADVTSQFDGWVARLAATCPDRPGASGDAEADAAGLVDVLAELERVKAACAAAQARVTAVFVEAQAAQAARWRQAAKDSDSFEAFPGREGPSPPVRVHAGAAEPAPPPPPIRAR